MPCLSSCTTVGHDPACPHASAEAKQFAISQLTQQVADLKEARDLHVTEWRLLADRLGVKALTAVDVAVAALELAERHDDLRVQAAFAAEQRRVAVEMLQEIKGNSAAGDPHGPHGYYLTIVTDALAAIARPPLALYFGFGDGGHFLRSPNRGPTTLDPRRDYDGFPWTGRLLDGGLLKNRKVPDRPDGRVYWTCGANDNHWHAFFWWDRSGDERSGSNSGFYVRGFGHEDVEPAFLFAKRTWPEVVSRQEHPLQLVTEASADAG